MHNCIFSKRGKKATSFEFVANIPGMKGVGRIKSESPGGRDSSRSRPGCVSRVSDAQPRTGELSRLSEGIKLLLKEHKAGFWTVHCQWSALGKLLCLQKEPRECFEVILTRRRVNSVGLLPRCLSHQGR